MCSIVVAKWQRPQQLLTPERVTMIVWVPASTVRHVCTGVRAGARETIYHDPSTVNAAIVTCGGLCPGLNDVVQGLVRKLEDYGVPDGNILGIRSAVDSPALPCPALPCLVACILSCHVMPV